MMKSRCYEICERECFCGFAGVFCDLVLEYAKLDTSELCLEWEGVARSWRDRSEIVAEKAERNVSVVERTGAPGYFLQLTLGMRPYTPSTEEGTDECSKFLMEREVLEKRWESTTSAEKKEKGLE